VPASINTTVVVCSAVFFAPDRVTSDHPIIIGAGFDGTGLTALRAALLALGHSPHSVKLPALAMPYCVGALTRHSPCPGELLTLYVHGFQHSSLPPSVWANVTAVMGHPVPMFTWDILEAFPNARVVLTVRDVDAWFDTISSVGDRTGFVRGHTRGHSRPKHWRRDDGNGDGEERADSDFKGHPLLRLWVWGQTSTTQQNLTRRHAVRKLLEHNAKVIHGVPKHQLLVWDMFDDASWAPLCRFLGVDAPDTPFPAPSSGSL
jgi:hypothetical protein